MPKQNLKLKDKTENIFRYIKLTIKTIYAFI